jgi:hypothetical protein
LFNLGHHIQLLLALVGLLVLEVLMVQMGVTQPYLVLLPLVEVVEATQVHLTLVLQAVQEAVLVKLFMKIIVLVVQELLGKETLVDITLEQLSPMLAVVVVVALVQQEKMGQAVEVVTVV